MSAKKIMFLVGYDYFNALASLDHQDITIVSPQKELAFGDALKSKFEKQFGPNFHLVSYLKADLLLIVDEVKPDFLVCLGWRRIIPDEVINAVPNCINVHPAILPQYKGYHPVPYVLINEEKEHGITAHMITPDLDGGDIILCRRFPIDCFSTLNYLQEKVNEIFPDFLQELVNILHGNEINTVENDTKLTKIIAGRRTPEDSEISGDMRFSDVYNFIRACDTKRFPAYYMKEGIKVYVSLSRIPTDITL